MAGRVLPAVAIPNSPRSGLQDLEFASKRPYYPTVRVFSRDPDPRTADVSAIARDLAQRYADCECMFDLRALFVEGGRVATAHLFDWGSLEGTTLAKLDPDHFKSELPDDVDPAHCV